MAFEIEIRIPINNKKRILDALYSKNFVLIKCTEQYDKVFQKLKKTDSGKIEELLFRIREESQKYIVTFKKIINKTDVIEYESLIGDPRSMEKIILENEYNIYAFIKKRRVFGKVDNINICLDEVEGLGCFLEAELIINDYENKKSAKSILLNFIESLGCDIKDISDKRYHTMIHELKFGGK